jgi:hypothetical protein
MKVRIYLKSFYTMSTYLNKVLKHGDFFHFWRFFWEKKGKTNRQFFVFFFFWERQFRAVTFFSKTLQQVTTYELPRYRYG